MVKMVKKQRGKQVPASIPRGIQSRRIAKTGLLDRFEKPTWQDLLFVLFAMLMLVLIIAMTIKG